MRPTWFGYHVVYRTGRPGQPTSLIASLVMSHGPLQAVIWSVPKRMWIYAPELAAGRLYDDLEQRGIGPVDRATAERIAREYLGTELPTEEQLHRMCEEGARQSEE
jgi:hypothetical protein